MTASVQEKKIKTRMRLKYERYLVQTTTTRKTCTNVRHACIAFNKTTNGQTVMNIEEEPNQTNKQWEVLALEQLDVTH